MVSGVYAVDLGSGELGGWGHTPLSSGSSDPEGQSGGVATPSMIAVFYRMRTRPCAASQAPKVGVRSGQNFYGSTGPAEERDPLVPFNSGGERDDLLQITMPRTVQCKRQYKERASNRRFHRFPGHAPEFFLVGRQQAAVKVWFADSSANTQRGLKIR